MIKNYPKKSSIRRVIDNHLNSRDSKDFLKERGILVHCTKRSDIASIGGDYYFNQKDYTKLKQKMDVAENYKKLGSITFSKKDLQSFEDAILSLSNSVIREDDNTRVRVSKSTNGNTKIFITYDEYKPSMIDLLDMTRREVEINLNTENKSGTCSLDFNMNTPNDYKKVKELLKYMDSTEEQIDINFEEISLNKLTKIQRIELFEEFFKRITDPWELVEIKKLKVKRDANAQEKKISEDQLEGINSAVLDGDNLSQNKFVKSTVDQGFYFSMASMRLDQKNSVNFIDLVIDFKSRPEMCEVKISNSGLYVLQETKSDYKEMKNVLDGVQQEILLLEFKNNLYEIYQELITDKKVADVEITSGNDAAAAADSKETE